MFIHKPMCYFGWFSLETFILSTLFRKQSQIRMSWGVEHTWNMKVLKRSIVTISNHFSYNDIYMSKMSYLIFFTEFFFFQILCFSLRKWKRNLSKILFMWGSAILRAKLYSSYIDVQTSEPFATSEYLQQVLVGWNLNKMDNVKWRWTKNILKLLLLGKRI